MTRRVRPGPRCGRPDELYRKAPDSALRAMAPVQVRITGAPEDVEGFAEVLAGLHQISASPMTFRPRSRGVAQGYMTIHIGGEST